MGLKEGDFEGFVFQDTDLAKWLEAVAYSLAYYKVTGKDALCFEDTCLKFVPYCNWGNRKEGEMAVWVKTIKS